MTTFAPPRPPAPPATPSEPPASDWRTRLPWRSAEAKAAPTDDLATLCLGAVSLAVAISMGRLFQGTSWALYGLAAAALGHVMAWSLRRVGAGLTVASLASALLSLLVAVELVVPQATTYGFPTPFTFQVLGQALTDAQTAFRTAVPPVAPSAGFLAAAVVGLCMCAFLADWAAFRMRTTFEACIPGLALFVFASVLGAKSHRGLALAGFAAAALLFLIVQRANLDGGHIAWFGGRDRGALLSLLGTGALLGAVAVVGALVLSPIVPGTSSKALLSFKKGGGGSGSGSRSTVSPLVDIQGRLREYGNLGVFSVRADRPAYWRLTSLDQFDGNIWSSNERYASSRGQLTPSSGLAGTKLVQQFTVSGLSSIWLPAAYRPAGVEGLDGLSYSPGSGSLITRKDTSNGLIYTITSVVPNPSAEQLRQAPPSVPGHSDLGDDYERYTKVPGASVSSRLRQLATQLGAGQATPYAKALALQDYLRGPKFRYSLRVPSGHSGSAIDRFLLETQVGYCEQFAGSYAVLARLLGLPTRVAVGFQPGEASNGTFAVQDKDAHAWPEVYLEGIGWTAFEPTPGRGNPEAAGYTNVPYTPPAQTPQNPTTPTTAATVPAPTPDQPSPAPPPEPDATTPPPPAPAGGGIWSTILAFLRRTAPLWALLGAVAALGAGSAAFVAWERRSRRRRAGSSPEARVHMAWEESVDALAGAGVHARPGETVAELLHRLSVPAGGAALAGVERGTPASVALVRLGGAVEQTAYAGRGAPAALADRAEADRGVVAAACRSSLGRWLRLRSDVDPRPALARLRAARSRRPQASSVSPAPEPRP